MGVLSRKSRKRLGGPSNDSTGYCEASGDTVDCSTMANPQNRSSPGSLYCQRVFCLITVAHCSSQTMRRFTALKRKAVSQQGAAVSTVVSGIRSDALMTTLLPVASAGARLFDRIINGWLNDVINAHAPSGTRWV